MRITKLQKRYMVMAIAHCLSQAHAANQGTSPFFSNCYLSCAHGQQISVIIVTDL